MGKQEQEAEDANVLQAVGTVNLREAPLAHRLTQVVIYLGPHQRTWHRTQHVCKETLTCGSRGSITGYSSLSWFTSYVVFLYITMKAKSRLSQYFFKIFFLISAFSVSHSSSQIFFSSSANIPSPFCPVLCYPCPLGSGHAPCSGHAPRLWPRPPALVLTLHSTLHWFALQGPSILQITHALQIIKSAV